jgi:hypothetical protein
MVEKTTAQRERHWEGQERGEKECGYRERSCARTPPCDYESESEILKWTENALAPTDQVGGESENKRRLWAETALVLAVAVESTR